MHTGLDFFGPDEQTFHGLCRCRVSVRAGIEKFRKEEIVMRKKELLVASLFIVAWVVVFLLPLERAKAEPNVINLRFANLFPPPSRHSKICEEFVAEVDKRTKGRIKITYYAGGSLLKAPAIFKGVEAGIADIGFAPTVYTPGRMPVTDACMMPLGYPSGWVSCQVANDFYNEFKPKEWDSVHVLWMHASNPSLVISKKPVRKLEDLRGMTIRAPGRVAETVKALGATPAPTHMMEVYDAMLKGVIDGVNSPFETVKTFRFAEVAKYITASWQVGNIYAFFVVMNKKSYKQLPPDLKQIFDYVCGEFKERTALMWNLIDTEGKEFALKKGVEIIYLPPEEAARWKKATEPVTEAFVKEMIGKGYSETEVRGWIKFLEKRIDYWTKKQITLRIKSATGPEEMRH